MLSVDPRLHLVEPRKGTRLGSPIGSIDGVDSIVRAKKEE